VAFLSGCVMSTWLAPVNWATLRVLARSGCRIRVPRSQGCCGALHHHMGEATAARTMARRLIDAFGGLDDCEAIVTNSAGCGAAMKEYGDLLADDPEYADRARIFAARVRDASEFLAARGAAPAMAPVRARAVYFDPCHLGIAQGIRREPRWLLRRVPGLELLEAPRREACCGSAGIYNLVHPDVSGRLADLLVEDLCRVEPDLIITANPGCLLQARWGLARRGGDARARVSVLHLMEVLDRATGTAP
jgi:glycolate oxidase iron-sulfur subunit